MTQEQRHDECLIATWEQMGITPPRRENHPKLKPERAAQAEVERLTKELQALQANGRLSELSPHLVYAVGRNGIRVIYADTEGAPA